VSTLGETLKVLYSTIAGRQNCREVVCTFVHSESEKTFLKIYIFGCLKSLGLREICEMQFYQSFSLYRYIIMFIFKLRNITNIYILYTPLYLGE
jgi:hypothetical protein